MINAEGVTKLKIYFMQTKETEIIDLVIPEYALCAIINNDYTGLTESEITMITNLIAKYGDTCSINGESYFSWHNDIDGNLGANCYDVQFVQIGN